MTFHTLNRILRNYHGLGPSKFHAFNQRVKQALTNNPKIPESTWGSNPGLINSYMAASDKHDAVYHEANYGSTLVIAERELLQQQLINYLDEIAADLEAEAVRSPEILLSSGFDLAKERRGINTRKKAALAAAEVTAAEHTS
jgi:glycerol-3-phosphate O-acyltransferase